MTERYPLSACIYLDDASMLVPYMLAFIEGDWRAAWPVRPAVKDPEWVQTKGDSRVVIYFLKESPRWLVLN